MQKAHVLLNLERLKLHSFNFEIGSRKYKNASSSVLQ